MTTPNSSYRRGMTLIELLVALGIIAIVLSLVVAGVQHVREAGRRITCQNNLREFGSALTQFEAAHRIFPASHNNVDATNWPEVMPNGVRYYSAHALLLPFVGQAPLAQKLDLRRELTPVWDPADPWPGFDDLLQHRIPLFLCPSDGAGEGRAGNNYRVCVGVGPAEVPWSANGPFQVMTRMPAGRIRDGLSHTIGVSEKLTGRWDEWRFDPARDAWYSALEEVTGRAVSLDEMLQTCHSFNGSPEEYYPFGGSTWLISGYEQTCYNHALTPNPKFPDCSASMIFPDHRAPISGSGVFSATSNHRGGVNSVFLDGSVRFVNDSINLDVWRACATIDGKEPATEF